MEHLRVGFAFCGSFCTYDKAMAALEQVRARYGDVTPIVSERSADTDTRFGEAHEFMREMERICDKRVIDSIPKAEPIGPQKLLDVLVIAPCTGSTLARLANGFSDTAVTMAAKAMWRNGRPVVLAVSTNDGLGASAKMIRRRNPPPWWPTSPESRIPSTRRLRAGSFSPCCWPPGVEKAQKGRGRRTPSTAFLLRRQGRFPLFHRRSTSPQSRIRAGYPAEAPPPPGRGYGW